ncbi:S24 family peptidase [Roseospira goensis]|uniref:Phage repressor protein C with HTH and peptisase S24 domain n=1 Tax=Roseospira goensis TaxID=391922 RepID=A0A7W6S246_9PROT|nr:S24 family peptidase [Roseospira goensis]MBB4287525.1 phage repressor protein C with HTH and peptisase S24 domain [Roseospira goensis]
MDTPADRLRQARKAAGFATAADAAARFGWNVNTYKSHENGQRGLRPEAAERYGVHFQVAPAWLQFGQGGALREGLGRESVRMVPYAGPGFAEDPAGVRTTATPDAPAPGGARDSDEGRAPDAATHAATHATTHATTGATTDATTGATTGALTNGGADAATEAGTGAPGTGADVDLARPRLDGLVGDRDLPVFGSALGGPAGEMIVSFEPIEWVRRPAPLDGVNGGFGFYMIGESMSPAFEPGDMILCHPTRPPYAGQDVLVIRRVADGQTALVKRLVRVDGRGLVLRQFNPPGEFAVPRDEVVSFHLVVGKYSRR